MRCSFPQLGMIFDTFFHNTISLLTYLVKSLPASQSIRFGSFPSGHSSLINDVLVFCSRKMLDATKFSSKLDGMHYLSMRSIFAYPVVPTKLVNRFLVINDPGPFSNLNHP